MISIRSLSAASRLAGRARLQLKQLLTVLASPDLLSLSSTQPGRAPPPLLTAKERPRKNLKYDWREADKKFVHHRVVISDEMNDGYFKQTNLLKNLQE